MNKLELKNKIIKYLDEHNMMIHPELLYLKMIYVESESDINEEDFEKLLIINKYIHEKYNNEINNESFTEYEKFFQELKRDYPDLYEEWMESECGDQWKGIYHPSKCFIDKKQLGKIYLSIDKKDLSKFAIDLLLNVVKNHIDDYNFKINNGEQGNRVDNLVIYFYSIEDLEKYLNIIATILREKPSIKINESHLFGKKVQNGVVYNLEKDSKNESVSHIICKYICDHIKNGEKIDDIVDCVEKEFNLDGEPNMRHNNNNEREI